MEKSIVAEGKTSNEAIQNGLKELGCKLEDVDVKVLENEEKKVFFSILDPRVVKVQLTLKEKNTKKSSQEYKDRVNDNDVKKCKESVISFLKDFSHLYGDIEYNVEEKDKVLFVEVNGKDAGKLIGYRGEAINAIQSILSSVCNKNIENNVKVIVDICNYKTKREETLKQLANKLERTVSRTGKKIILEPMNAYERKIIHTALQNSKKVTTYSIGEEPRRKLVVDKK